MKSVSQSPRSSCLALFNKSPKNQKLFSSERNSRASRVHSWIQITMKHFSPVCAHDVTTPHVLWLLICVATHWQWRSFTVGSTVDVNVFLKEDTTERRDWTTKCYQDEQPDAGAGRRPDKSGRPEHNTPSRTKHSLMLTRRGTAHGGVYDRRGGFWFAAVSVGF